MFALRVAVAQALRKLPRHLPFRSQTNSVVRRRYCESKMERSDVQTGTTRPSFLLGAAEAGFFPGVIVYLSHWFLQTDRAKATSNFMSAISVSSVLGSPLAGLILGHSWHSLSGWRWLFVMEGMRAIVLLVREAVRFGRDSLA